MYINSTLYTQMVWTVCNAMAERKWRRFARVPTWSLQKRQTRWGNITFIIHALALNYIYLLRKTIVPAKQWTHTFLDVGRRHFHATCPVFRCCVETWVPWSRNLETLYETIRQDHRQSITCLCRHCQERISSVDQRWTNRKLLNEFVLNSWTAYAD